jgi:amino acid adenylation domain-containing protein
VTLYIILLTAFNLLLYQYTQQEDILISSTQAGRNLPKVQGLIGFFNHIVPLRTNLSGNPSFLELVNHVHRVVLEAYQYQDMPLQLLAESLNLADKQLYQVMFAFQNVPPQLLKLSEIRVRSEYLNPGTANFDLFLSLELAEKETKKISGYLEYKTDLFSAVTIEKMRVNFQESLEIVVKNPEQKLSDFPVFREANQPQISVQSLPSVENYVAPRTPIEAKLARIFAEVLHRETVGIYDNFFQLGGHSLLATQVISRINTAFSAELPILRLFERSTVAELAELIQTHLEDGQKVSNSPIQPVSRKTKLPLSSAQQRLWFLDQFGSRSPYNLPMDLAFSGKLDVVALQQSLEEIVRRHESLRTTFATDEGIPYQVIHPQMRINLPVIDLSEYDSETQRTEIENLTLTEARRCFDLSRDPMLRGILLYLGNSPLSLETLQLDDTETHHILLLTLHHIAADGWSLEILMQELTTLYSAFSQRKPSPLPDLPIQYADFAVWQRNYLQGDIFTRQLDYWKVQLANAPELLQLPTDYPRPPQESFQGARIPLEIDANLTQQLRQLSQKQGTTLYMILLAAFQVLMYRYSGQTDVVVGSPIANRNRQEIEPLIGFFVNTLAMRADLSGVDGKPPSFLEVLAQVKQTAQAAYDCQDLPFEKLVGELHRERSVSIQPLFNVVFVLHNRNVNEQLQFNGLQYQLMEIHNGTAKYDLLLQLTESSTTLTGSFEYSIDLFEADTIRRMVRHFQTLLAAIIVDANQSITTLSILPADEKHQLLVTWNKTRVDYSQNQCIHQMFEEQVERTPDAIAVVFENQQLTYQELNCRGNQLGQYLRDLGVKPDDLIGLCVERSPLMIIGILGILKAGGAYVPLDPTYPQDRLSFMLEDGQVSILLTQQKLIPQLPQHQAKSILLDVILDAIYQNSSENLSQVVNGSNLAYVIYTSGSTGKPKGVMIEQFGLYNLAKFQQSIFNLGSHSRILQFTSLSFDVSIWEIIMALGAGGTLFLGTKYSLLPGMKLIERLRNDRITHLNLTPSALAVMPVENLPTLETIIVAGEACTADLVQKWGIGRRFFNAYGPTEITVIATVKQCDPDDPKAPIGRPITNTQTYLLDSQLQPVPVGLPGELYIGGVGVARGYLNRPQLTQEKFIDNPFGEGRLYKTGDLCRYLPDGNLVFLGRIDHQVKVRGFRIEVGEIETVLRQHSDVQDVVVVADSTDSNKGLIAYLTPQIPEQKIAELRCYLKQKLPDYMIPGIFVSLEQFPKTPSDKIDRKALPAPSIISSTAPYEPPRSQVEQNIARVWEKVLNRKEVSIHDSFFEVGGHSLSLIQVHSLLQPNYPELKVIDLFSYPTIHGLATYLDQGTTENGTTQQQVSQASGAKRRASQTARQQRRRRQKS